MHIAILCPFSQGPARGNLTTVDRISRFLQKCGCQVSLLPLDAPNLAELQGKLADDPPDLLHAFHAFHAGPSARKLAAQLKKPYLITLTGSDLFDPALRDHQQTRQSIADAVAVTCFDQLVAEQALSTFGMPHEKLVVIPQGVEPFSDSTPLSHPEDAFIILLPAALRPVKGIDDAITQLAPLAAEEPGLQLWLAGGILDKPYSETIIRMANERPWARLLGEIPRQEIGRYYLTADLVLNSSWFEGGMANALLEAMVMGRPVLARTIDGNRSLLQHQKTGWLYADGEELRKLLKRLMQQPEELLRVGQAAKEQARLAFSPERESASLRDLYSRLLETHRRT